MQIGNEESQSWIFRGGSPAYVEVHAGDSLDSNDWTYNLDLPPDTHSSQYIPRSQWRSSISRNPQIPYLPPLIRPPDISSLLNIFQKGGGWKVINASRPLSKMKHAAKHLKDFQKIDPSLTSDDVAKILEYVRKYGSDSLTKFGGKAYEMAVDIGGKSVNVKVIESASGVIKTGYPVP